jgi:FkbH-like protein
LHRRIESLFAPFDQVLQTLLDPASIFATNRAGLNVILYREEDLGSPSQRAANIQSLHNALAARAPSFAVPVLVFPGPLPTEIPNVYALTPDWIEAHYPVAEIHSPDGEKLGGVPYTEDYFTALATAIIRKAHAIHHAPAKVLALDCDHTLWQGICGEEPVRMLPGHEALQRFAKHQREQGVLLALSSKNNLADVAAAFAEHPEFPLRWSDITAHRIDWNSKSLGLRAISQELSLGLDSFVFLDDNAKEVSEVDEQLPEVLALTLPPDPARFPHFLSHLWALDRARQTAGDVQRAESYAAVQEFGKAIHAAHTLEDFYRTLNLEVQIAPLTPAQIPRAAQLTQRTNQFNFTTRRMSEADIQTYTTQGDIFTIHVRDRFGDYGFTGLLLGRSEPNQYTVDNFLLSCRVLGRRVEHHVRDWLTSHTALPIIWNFTQTSKNAPAAEFHALLQGKVSSAASPSAPAPAPPSQARHEVDYAFIAAELDTVPKIRARMQAAFAAGPSLVTETEQTLARIWAELLHESNVAASSNFFDLGGHSLLVVLLLMRIKESFQVELGIDDVYAADATLESMARRIDELTYSGGIDPAEYQRILASIAAMSDEEAERELAAHADPARR